MRQGRRSGVRFGVVLLSVLACLVVGTAPEVAEAQDTSTATISGPTEPVRWGTVLTCVAAQNTSGRFVDSTTADYNTGEYSLTVPAGTYAIWFWACGRDAEFGPASSLYRNAFSYDDATLVTVAAGESVTLQKQDRMPAGGRVAGSVVDSAGQYVPGCMVYAVTRTPTPTPLSRIHPDFDGSYELTNLAPGSYTVLADCGPGFHRTYHGNTVDPGVSPEVIVSAGVVTSGVDIAVSREGGSVAGHLTTADGRSANGACVWAVDSGGAVVGHSETMYGGYWQLADLPEGEVRIGFAGCENNLNYVPEWYEDAADLADADPIMVDPSVAVTGIEVVIAKKGSLRFWFRDPSGMPVSGVCVWLTDTSGAELITAKFASGPEVTIWSLVPGAYAVKFTDCGETGFDSEWYADAATAAESTPVVVPDGGGSEYDVEL